MFKDLNPSKPIIRPQDSPEWHEPIGGVPAVPSLSNKVRNAAKATGRIVRAVVNRDAVRVSLEERDRRLSICRKCEYWQESGNLGLGECRQPESGCTRIKHKLATEACPLNKWQFTESIA